MTDALGGAFDATTRCPGCSASMRSLALEQTPHGEVVVDLCVRCHALWFDAFESVRLTPAATLALFEAVRVAAEPVRAEQKSLACPRCRAGLVETRDLRHTTRFVYWRCPRGHGRFTPFVQFLREKDFLRPLAPRDIERLRSTSGPFAARAAVRLSICPATRAAPTARGRSRRSMSAPPRPPCARWTNARRHPRASMSTDWPMRCSVPARPDAAPEVRSTSSRPGSRCSPRGCQDGDAPHAHRPFRPAAPHYNVMVLQNGLPS